MDFNHTGRLRACYVNCDAMDDRKDLIVHGHHGLRHTYR